MANVISVIALLFLCSVITASVINGKAFYCRDPDTGKFHAINSTWASTSFCGNYSCKLRKVNVSEIEYIPLRQFNVSELNITNVEQQRNADTVEATTPVTIEKTVESDTQPILHLNLSTEIKSPEKEANNDRYLTEAEIKSISEVLHTIKKSDLDAIIEIYNLAQDIYKEIDKQTSDNDLVSPIIKDEKSNTNDMKSVPDKKQASYWYEPLNVSLQKSARSVDSEHQGSNVVHSAVSYKSSPKQSYYSGPLLSNDFAKIPYYYPMSNFQRMSSYLHQTPYTKPCSQSNEHALINKVLKRPEQKLIQPSILLPYPFSYVNNFNTSYLNDNLYSTNYWSYYDYFKHRSYPYAYINPIPNNAVDMNSQMNSVQAAERNSVSKEENDILDKLIAKAKEVKLPPWQTASLPDHVLDEVRANIEKSALLKPFPFRKKVNLEKVGKVIKLDEFSRKKRDTDNKLENQTSTASEDFYESFIETLTCPTDTQLGYFRRGNLSKPYPECCPERIEEPAVVIQHEQNLKLDHTTNSSNTDSL